MEESPKRTDPDLSEPDTASWSYEDILEQATSSTGGPWTDILAARAANMTFAEIATKFNLGNRITARRRVDTDFRKYSRGVADVYLADTLRAVVAELLPTAFQDTPANATVPLCACSVWQLWKQVVPSVLWRGSGLERSYDMFSR